MRRSRLKTFLLYFAPQFSVYTKFGIDPPFHLIGSFECFGHAFLLHHCRNDDFHALVAGLVDLGKVPMQRSVCEQVCVENRAMFFQIAAAHMSILANLVFRFLWQRKVWNEIIALLTVSAAHFLK